MKILVLCDHFSRTQVLQTKVQLIKDMRPSQYYKKSINFPWTKWIFQKTKTKQQKHTNTILYLLLIYKT